MPASDGPDIEFQGLELARVDTREIKTDPDPPSWCVLSIYRTDRKRFVVVRERHFRGGAFKIDSDVLETDAQVVEWFGWSRVTKRLFADARLQVPRRQV